MLDPLKQRDEIKQLLEENQRLLKLVVSISERTRRYVLWGRIMSAIYLLIIIAPIILAIIFLPPLVKSTIRPYQDLLNSVPSKNEAAQSIFNEVQGLLGD